MLSLAHIYTAHCISILQCIYLHRDKSYIWCYEIYIMKVLCIRLLMIFKYLRTILGYVHE